MKTILLAFAGALAWIGLIEGSSPGAALFGAVLGVVVGRRFFGPDLSPRLVSAPRRIWAILRLLFRFSLELIVANWIQLRLVLAPKLRIRPHWLTYRSTLKDPRLRVGLGLMISLTPGTVTAHLEEDRLVIHILDSDDPQAVADRIRCRFESLLKELDTA